MSEATHVSDNSYPFVAFKIHDEYYCISSNAVAQMIIQADLNAMPKNPKYLSGVLNVRGIIYPIIDLRTLFDIEDLQAEIDVFNEFKSAHLDWVKALENSITENKKFLLTTDPHQCSFGKWYYNYHTDDEILTNILSKIEAPHTKLHRQAETIEVLKAKGDIDGAKKALEIVENLCYKEIVPLLDSFQNAYQNANKGMIILTEENDSHLGLAVDTITSIEHFEGCLIDNASLQFAHNKYIKNVIVSQSGKIFLELDLTALFGLQDEFNLEDMPDDI